MRHESRQEFCIFNDENETNPPLSEEVFNPVTIK